jgi:thiol-disulfide isomerase/thioredoxin
MMAWFWKRAGAVAGLSFILATTGACGGNKPAPATPSSGGGDSDTSKGPAEVGKAAPDLSIQTVNGKGQITKDSLSGKVAIVDFWATWCGPCKQSFPKLEEISKQNTGKVQVVGISVDDKSDGVADFAKSNGATFPIGWDDGHSIASRWKVDSMPTTFILDGSGTVRFIHAGYHDGEADVIAKELATLAAEPAKGKSGGDGAAANDGKPKDPPPTDPPGETKPADPPADPPADTGKKPAGKKKPPGKKKPAGKPKPKQQ